MYMNPYIQKCISSHSHSHTHTQMSKLILLQQHISTLNHIGNTHTPTHTHSHPHTHTHTHTHTHPQTHTHTNLDKEARQAVPLRHNQINTDSVQSMTPLLKNGP